jgi:RHS repeat-associated protein
VLQRQDYDPFGNRVIRERLAITPEQSDRLEYGFSTKPLDAETGLIYYVQRYYGPNHGRWLSVDPIGERGGINTWSFCKNDPLSLIDDIGCQPIAPPYYGLNPHTAKLLAEIAKDLGATAVVLKTATELVDERNKPLAPPAPSDEIEITEKLRKDLERQLEEMLKANAQKQPQPKKGPDRPPPPPLEDGKRRKCLFHYTNVDVTGIALWVQSHATSNYYMTGREAVTATGAKSRVCFRCTVCGPDDAWKFIGWTPGVRRTRKTGQRGAKLSYRWLGASKGRRAGVGGQA